VPTEFLGSTGRVADAAERDDQRHAGHDHGRRSKFLGITVVARFLSIRGDCSSSPSPPGGRAAKSCSGNQKLIEWNVKGPTGHAGPTGPAGPQGPVGPPDPSATAFNDAFGTDTGTATTAHGEPCTVGDIILTASPIKTAGGIPARGQLLEVVQNRALFAVLGSVRRPRQVDVRAARSALDHAEPHDVLDLHTGRLARLIDPRRSHARARRSGASERAPRASARWRAGGGVRYVVRRRARQRANALRPLARTRPSRRATFLAHVRLRPRDR
jgi:hypothetical protein